MVYVPPNISGGPHLVPNQPLLRSPVTPAFTKPTTFEAAGEGDERVISLQSRISLVDQFANVPCREKRATVRVEMEEIGGGNSYVLLLLYL